jgi:hypothetical protein
MLRIYICPQCYNFRMVSRKPDAICFHCGSPLVRSDVEYSQYMDMTEAQRIEIKEKFIARMQQYNSQLDSLFHMK